MVSSKRDSGSQSIETERVHKGNRHGSCPLGVDTEFLLCLDDPQAGYQTTRPWVSHLAHRLN